MHHRGLIVLLLCAGGTAAAYPLDALPRQILGGRAVCPDVELVTYGGSVIPYQKATRVYVGFVDKLREMEEIVRDTAAEVYGRAPRRLVHDGTYACRAVRRIAGLLSEHALGNAIDVEGFDFGAAPRGTAAPAGLRGSFSVRLAKHWNATRGVGAVHARFLRLLAQRVIDRQDLFTVVLGPAYPGHEGHFHFDLAPYRLVAVFDEPSSLESLLSGR